MVTRLEGESFLRPSCGRDSLRWNKGAAGRRLNGNLVKPLGFNP